MMAWKSKNLDFQVIKIHVAQRAIHVAGPQIEANDQQTSRL